MKLFHPYFSTPLEFEEDVINVLIIENKKSLRIVTEDILSQINGTSDKVIFSISNKEQKMSKYVEFIINPFILSTNNVRILKKLYENMSLDAFNDEMLIDTYKINDDLIGYVERLIIRTEYDLSYNANLNFPDLLKILNVKFEEQDQTLVSRIIDYLSLSNEILGIKLFIFLNLKVLLEDNEILEIYKHCHYNKVNILLIEGNIQIKIPGEKLYIIDEDLCDIF